MIKAEGKPLEEIQAMIADYERIVIVGCGTCVTISFAGGEKEVGVLASKLRMVNRLNGQDKKFAEAVVLRQCEPEYVEEVADLVSQADAVISLACGIGAQAMADRYPDIPVFPGVNTKFLGLAVEHGNLRERCVACGDCVLGITAGICPIARCSKQLLNGPCGGSQDGKCEIDPDVDCAWQLIYDRLKAQGRLDLMMRIVPPKDWSRDRFGGPRRIVREDVKL